MTRIRGFENICNELGYVGEFYTLTAPSKYHATTKAGYRNSKWNGASPSDTQSYLTGLWARIRAKLHREEIRIFGIRVAEPHHDGTPHWHMLMFMLPEDVERVRIIIRDYAWEEDHHELRSDKAKKRAFMLRPLTRKRAALPAMLLNTFQKISMAMLSMVKPMTKAVGC